MALFSILHSLGPMVKDLPILEQGGDYFSDGDFESVRGSGSIFEEAPDDLCLYVDHDLEDRSKARALQHFRITGEITKHKHTQGRWQNVNSDSCLAYSHLFEDFQNSSDLELHWNILLMARHPRGDPRPGAVAYYLAGITRLSPPNTRSGL
jgi:hypothetical protein